MPSDQIPCPLCRKVIFRSKFFCHLYSAAHREAVHKEFIAKKGSINRNRTTLPFIMKEGQYASFCLGCSKAYCKLKENGAHVCNHTELHNKRLDEIIGPVVPVAVNEIVESGGNNSQEVEELRKKCERLQKELSKSEKLLEMANDTATALEVYELIVSEMKSHRAFSSYSDNELLDIWREIVSDQSLLEFHGR